MVFGVVDVFRALADETRRLVLDELAASDGKSLFEICSLLTTRHGLGLTRQAISQHLGVLESAGLIMTERRGRTKFPLLQSHATRRDRRAVACQRKDRPMRINLTSLFVDDQRAALAFYTDVLGFIKRRDIPSAALGSLSSHQNHPTDRSSCWSRRVIQP